MSERRRNTSIVIAACLPQLCFVLVESLILVYPSMYAFAYIVRNTHLELRAFQVLLDVAIAGVVVLPVSAAVRAWFLLARGRSSGWYLSVVVDAYFALVYGVLISVLYTSPPSSGHGAWAFLSSAIALPLVHLAVIVMPMVRSRLVPKITSANVPFAQTF